MIPAILIEGVCETSQRDTLAWRIVETDKGIFVESEMYKDAMGNIAFRQDKHLGADSGTTAFSVIDQFVKLIKAKKKLPVTTSYPDVLFTYVEKKKFWRLVQTKKRLVIEEVSEYDLMGQACYSIVADFQTELSVARAIFCHLLKLLGRTA